MRKYLAILLCLIGLANSVPAANIQPCCLDLTSDGDYTGDGVVDIDDLARFAELWLTCCNQEQFSALAQNWGSRIHQLYEAESAFHQTTFSPFTVQDDPFASGGKYITVPEGTGNNWPAPDGVGVIDVDFEVDQAVAVWMRMYTPTYGDDSFWLQIDNSDWTTWNSIGAMDTWEWKKWGYLCGPKPGLMFRYANGSETSRPCQVDLNGEEVGQLLFPPTDNWSSWETVVLHVNMLESAANTIRVTASTELGGPNLDQMTVTGKDSIDLYEAEDNIFSGSSVSTEHVGYSKNGYVDFGGSGTWCEFSSVLGQTGTDQTSHTLSIGWREDGSQLDKILLTSDLEFQPQGKEGFAPREDVNIPETASVISSGRLSVWVDPSGSYGLYADCPRWVFLGSLGQAVAPSVMVGADVLGSYKKISFTYDDGRYEGSLRLYNDRPVVLCETTCLTDSADRLFGTFPEFTTYPTYLYSHGYEGLWSWAKFDRGQIGADSPAIFYDKNNFACMVSPASNFMDAWTSYGDTLQFGLQPYVTNVPQDYTHSVMLVFDQGINQTFDTWGQALTDLQGKVRPANDADKGLKYLGYWTDNGAHYYYQYDQSLGTYEDTLMAVKKSYDDANIDLGYMQLDSWWYKKAPPEITDPYYWSGLYLYEPIEEFFPNGLADFNSRLGLPFITHNRWVRDDSPYRDQYEFSADVSIDPAFWDKIIGDIASWGVETYEQDWLDIKALPEYTFGHGDLYMDNMARACAQNGLTMQYCMGTPRIYMQSSKYSHLTTLRVSHDRFYPSDWRQFFYCSRFVRSLGAWPWVDVFRSTETDHMLMCILSAGMAGMADGIGQNDLDNILAISRHDGVLVKPDVPIVPSDSTYIRRARGDGSVTAFTYTDFPAQRVAYVFDWLSGKTGFKPAEFGFEDDVYVYDYFADSGAVVSSSTIFNKDEADWSYYVLSPIGPSGIAFLGDKNMFVSCGKNRISDIADTGSEVDVTVVFAPHDGPARLHGYSPVPVTVVPDDSASVSNYIYNGSTGSFSFDILPLQSFQTVAEVSLVLKTSGDLSE